jgi:TPR repeat protein
MRHPVLFLLSVLLAASIGAGCTGRKALSPAETYAQGQIFDAMGYPKEAGFWYIKAGNQGHPLAQLEAGFMYKYGRTGFLEDPYEAERWYGSATKPQPHTALADFGFVYEYGKSGVLRTEQQAEQWFKKAAASLQRAASRGDLEAQTVLGGMYGSGTGVAKNAIMARQLWQDAAQKGHAQAQYRLARAYWHDAAYKQALPWMKAAAQAGVPEAEYHLAVMYQFGYGVTPSRDEALRWLRLAANQGYLFAEREMKRMADQGLL